MYVNFKYDKVLHLNTHTLLFLISQLAIKELVWHAISVVIAELKMNWLLLGSTVLLLFAIQQTLADDDKENLKLVMDKMEKVTEAEEIIKTDISLDKQGDEVTINGKAEQLVELNDNYKVVLNLFL